MFDNFDTGTLKTIAFTLLPLFGLFRLVKRWLERRKSELPRGSALNDAWIRAEVRRGHRPRAIQAWRALHGGTSADARAAIDAIEAELNGRPHADEPHAPA